MADNRVGVKTNSDGVVELDPRQSKGFMKTAFNYVVGEHNRIKQVQQDIKKSEEGDTSIELVQHYHLGRKNGLKFQMLPSLNQDVMEAQKGLPFTIWNSDGTINEELDLNASTDAALYIKKAIKDSVNKMIANHVRLMREYNLTEVTDTGIKNNAYDSAIFHAAKESTDMTAPGAVEEFIAANFVTSNLVMQAEYSRMFSGDIAYYKDAADYTKRIPGTYTDGQQLYLPVPSKDSGETLANYEARRDRERFFTISTVNSIEVVTPYMNSLAELLKGKEGAEGILNAYKKVNAADAQAWITVERWKFLLERLGKWSNSHDVVFDKMQNNVDLDVSEMKLAAQPLKGVYFDSEKGHPIYLKYSQAVILPSLAPKGSEMGTGGKEGGPNEDELITIDGVKAGAINPQTIHNSDYTLKEDYTLTTQTLRNDRWKLQQDLPVKTAKETDVGSQIQKNIFGALASNRKATFDVNGKDVAGDQLAAMIHQTVSDLSNLGRKEFTKRFGIDADGSITNAKALNKGLVAELMKRGGNDNVIKALQGHLSPLGIPGFNDKIQNAFAAMATKAIVKIQTNGGSFIQMSNFGLNKTQAEEQGIIWTPWAREGDNGLTTADEYSYLKDADGNKVLSESGKPLIRPAGVMLSGSYIKKLFPNYRDVLKEENGSEKLFGKLNPKTNKYEGGMIDPRMLQNLIGYRIPNQALASNDALQVVGILPESAGDTVVAYTGVTTKTGSDFDIDKMFMMLPSGKSEYVSYEETKEALNEILFSDAKGDTKQETLSNLIEDYNILNDGELSFTADDIWDIPKEDRNEFRSSAIKQLLEALTEGYLSGDIKSEYLDGRMKNIPNQGDVLSVQYIEPSTSETNSKKQLQNKLIELYRASLLNENVVAKLMTPIDYDFVKNDIQSLTTGTDLSADLAVFNIDSQINTLYEFRAGKAGVGQLANALVDHNRGLMADTTIYNFTSAGDKSHVKRAKSLDDNLILSAKLDELSSVPLSDEDLKAYVADYNSKSDNKITNAEALRSIRIEDALSAVMNGFVDIAKDAYITRGGWSTMTTNPATLLLRTGVHPFYVNAFIAQPVIREYMDYKASANSKISKKNLNVERQFAIQKVAADSDVITIPGIGSIDIIKLGVENSYFSFGGKKDFPNRLAEALSSQFDATRGEIMRAIMGNQETISTAIGKVKEEVEKFETEGVETENPLSAYSLDYFRKAATGEVNDPEFNYQVFKMFQTLQSAAKGVTTNNKANKVDVQGYGKNEATMIATLNNIHEAKADTYTRNSFMGYDSKLQMSVTMPGQEKPEIVDTLLKTYQDNIQFVATVMQNNPLYFSVMSPKALNTFNSISLEMKGTLLKDDETAGIINEEFYSYLLSGFAPFKHTNEEKKEIVYNMVHRVQSMIKKFPQNKFLAEISPSVNVSTDPSQNAAPLFVRMSGSNKTASYKTDLINDWHTLYNDKKPEVKQFAEDLIKYVYYTTGFKQTAKSLTEYIPREFWFDNNFNDYILSANRELEFGSDLIIKEFSNQFFKHTALERDTVKTVSQSMLKYTRGYDYT